MIEVIRDSVAEHGCYCMRSMKSSPGYRKKAAWTEQQTESALTYLQLKEGNKALGFVEYAPGETAWRVLHADGYLVIHCLWIGETGRGLGSRLIQHCLEDAARQGKKGVAVLTNADTAWIAAKEIFVKNGFTYAGQAPYSFELYMKKFPDDGHGDGHGDDALPSFPTNWQERLERFPHGLTILRTDKCPYLEAATDNIVKAAKQANIEPHIIVMEDRAELMELSPSPYGVFNVIYNGKLLAYHRLTARSFLKMLLGGETSNARTMEGE